MSSVFRPTGAAGFSAVPQGSVPPRAVARGADEGTPRRSPGTPPDVRWTPGSGADQRAARESAGYGTRGPSGAGAGNTVDAWSAHVETLGRWCRSDWPLSSTGSAAASALALALGLRTGAPGSGNGRGALGELLRLVLAAAQCDVATLRAALTEPRTPQARALLAGTVGAPWLLCTVRLRGATIVGTELRAVASRAEAAAMLGALAGGAGDGGPLPALRALASGWVRGTRRDVPLLGDGVAAGAAEAVEIDEALTLVLPLLALDAPVPSELPAAALAAVHGGAVPKAASPFLDVGDPRAIGALEPLVPMVEEDEDEDAEGDAPDASDADDDPSDPGAEAEASEREADEDDDDAPEVMLAEDDAIGRRLDRTFLAHGTTPSARVEATVAATPDEPIEAEVMAAALARLRSRSATVDRVTASVATDDGVVEHVTDIVPWLTDATTVEVRALARDGWSGEEAIEVARALAEDDPEIAQVVRHARRNEAELVVEIDGRAASAWLRAHRPELADRLDELLDDE